MSHLLQLSDEDKIKIARDAVRCAVPISPVIQSWLHANSLFDRVANPRKADAVNTATPDEQGNTG